MLLHVRLLFHHHASRTVFWDKNCSFTWCHFFLLHSFNAYSLDIVFVSGTGLGAGAKACWVFTSLEQNSESEHRGGLFYAMLLRWTNVSSERSWRRHLMRRFQVGWFTVACESCLLLWFFSLLYWLNVWTTSKNIFLYISKEWEKLRYSWQPQRQDGVELLGLYLVLSTRTDVCQGWN